MKKSYIDCTDNFCGCGGSGQGVRAAGVEIALALNHWKIATDTYSTNFPEAKVYCADASLSDPRYFPSTTVAVMSPECRPHTPAGGNYYKKAMKKQMELFEKGLIDPAAERSRMTMWDVPRFTEYHGYEIVVVENVVEARTKWPLFDVWLQAMHTLGYNHKCLYLNSMFFLPTPQSRDRMFVVFWKKGNPAPDLEFTPKAWCKCCEKDVYAYQWWKDSQKKYGKYGKNGQYLYRCTICTNLVEPYYYASFNIIDWSIPGKPVLGRKKPLSDPTIRRIKHGLETLNNEYVVIPTGNKAIMSPYFINTDHAQGKDQVAIRSGLQPTRAITTSHSTGVVFPQPLSTAAAGDHHAIVPSPFIVENNGQSTTRSITKPYPTQTTEMKHGILAPESFNAFISYYYSGSTYFSKMNESCRTVTTRDRMGFVTHKKPTLEECTYRTLRAHEVKAAMAFENDYQILGNSRDQVRQLGNAVTPPVMEWIMKRCVESLS